MTTESHRGAAWGPPVVGEPRWPATLAVLIGVLLYISLPVRLLIGPWWLVPTLELSLLIPLTIVAPRRMSIESRWRQIAAIVIIAILNLANILSLALLVDHLVVHPTGTSGTRLLESAAKLWLTNIIVFALWFWELDRGGPDDRASTEHREPDFLFPQMVTPGCAPKGWGPRFFDYLYLAFTNSTAFSPTDTMPLTTWAKTLMLIEGLVSLLIVALVASRAVNILG